MSTSAPLASRRARASRRWRFVSFGLRPITTPLVFALRGPPRDGCGSTRARTQQSHPSASASACRTAAVVSAQVSSSESRHAGDGTKQIGKTVRADLVAASPLDCVSTHSGGDRRGRAGGLRAGQARTLAPSPNPRKGSEFRDDRRRDRAEKIRGPRHDRPCVEGRPACGPRLNRKRLGLNGSR
jgi:hypothetical protein